MGDAVDIKGNPTVFYSRFKATVLCRVLTFSVLTWTYFFTSTGYSRPV